MLNGLMNEELTAKIEEITNNGKVIISFSNYIIVLDDIDYISQS
jgi:hypothetical protein